MSVLNILFVGSDEVARSIAKKSDSRDVDNYCLLYTSDAADEP